MKNNHACEPPANRGGQTGRNGFHTVPNQVPMGHNILVGKVALTGLLPRSRWDASPHILLPATLIELSTPSLIRKMSRVGSFPIRVTVLLAVALMLAGLNESSARNYFVSTSGKDRNSGTTSTQPLRYVQTAHDRAAAGDIIEIESGNYPELLKCSQQLRFVARGGTVTLGHMLPPSLSVDAGFPRTVTKGSIQIFQASVTFNGSPVTSPPVYWEVSGSPSSVTVYQPTTHETSVLFSETGVFTLIVTATVGGMSATNSVQVNVTPIVIPGGNLFSVTPWASDSTLTGSCDCGRTPAFQATAFLHSTVTGAGADPSFSWEQVSGPADSLTLLTPDRPNTTAKLTSPGCYVFRLTVRSNSTSISLFSDVQVSVSSVPARSFLSVVSGPYCPIPPDSGLVIPRPAPQLRNSHACATIRYEAKVIRVSGLRPFIDIITGDLGPSESIRISCHDASVQVTAARYISGCGAGDTDGCGAGSAEVPAPGPSIVALRDDSGAPAMVLDPVPGRVNIVEVSSDCRAWSSLTSEAGSGQPILISDPNASREPHLFYRARLQ